MFSGETCIRCVVSQVAVDDRITLTDLELQAYNQALQPKLLELIAGDHFAPYTRAFSQVSSAVVQWFQQHLHA
ncbi:hypothetical protein D5074_02515 [Pectobacterium polaris]|nr:hypothetical protein D5074_02515 [Pectobacterium polaris]